MKKTNLSESLKQLEHIVEWFDAQKDADVEQGLEKVREGAILIKESKARLSEIENEFEEVKKDLEGIRERE
jgi:predicted transcriptional regulator